MCSPGSAVAFMRSGEPFYEFGPCPEYAPRIGRLPARRAAAIKLIHYPAIVALECAILGTTPSSSVLCAMELVDYLRDQAVMYRQLAERPTILSSRTRCLSWRWSARRSPTISRII
jgi:hypothetical protein